ncbi:MAG TPA: phenylalanine--tRNA ligase subunit beta [Terriglobales bacterium]|nr:phenylalanine--tRNA ligase subunit beta [Terriglobales bacterium]
MKILPNWLREFVEIPVDDRRLADDLTNAGISVESVDTVNGQSVFDVDFTPNRVDAMNHYGVARDCAAVYVRELKGLGAAGEGARGSGDSGTPGGSPGGAPGPTLTPGAFKIEIEDAQGCARYTAQVVRGIKIAPSPEKIAQRLGLVEARPINNIADASNYVLFEMGHPTHCFDLDLLEGGKIVVRRARKGETLKTLDGVERKLHPEDLVIADAKRPVALAGVMGGFDTMITDRTKNVLIESAWFDPASVRRTARRHDMHTDASHRFERGADFGATPTACARVAQLILETAGGKLEDEQIDALARTVERPTLSLRRSEVQRILGQDVPEQEIERILRRLGFGVTGRALIPDAPHRRPRDVSTTGSGGAHAAIAEAVVDFQVAVPTWRLDVEREIDLIEEIARIYGFDRFESTLPSFAGAVVEQPHEKKAAKIRERLLALGYNEAISLAFISHEDAQRFSQAAIVEIANPVSEEASVMRNSMVPGILGMVAYNLNRGNGDVRLFEQGTIFERIGERVEERRRGCIGATGRVGEGGVHAPARPYTFFDLKGDLETLLRAFEHRSLYFDEHALDYYHPGRSARAVMDGASVARFGQLHPQLAAERKLKQEVFLAELDLERLFTHALRQPFYREISRYPAVERDFSFIFDDAVTCERVRSLVEALRIMELRSVEPAEVFRGGAIPAGKYSMLLRATFQSSERTLRDEDMATWSAQIVKALQAIGGVLRSS